MAALTDPIADFLIRIKNAYRAGKDECSAPYSKMKAEVARILKEEGYIWSYEVDASGKFPEIKVKTKYVETTPAMLDLQRISRPGLRHYVSSSDIPKVLNGMGITILSTSRGIMTGQQAKKETIGGELLAKVW